MIKIFNYILVFSTLLTTVSASAQTTTSSPYSQFGLGDLTGPHLPQARAMGGIGMGLRKPGPYNNINHANPASYSSVNLTTFDIGAYGGLRQLSNNNISENGFSGTLSHITFAVPVTKRSSLSFGLLPYSQVGYQFKNSGEIDTNSVDYVYGGDGGLSKAYLGYGFLLGKNLSLGFNVGYIFGNMKETRSTEFPEDPLALNSRTQNENSVGGLSYDLGLQYVANLSSKTKLILGYTGNVGNDINSKNSTVTTRYRKNFEFGNESPPVDTTFFVEGAKTLLNMPVTHTIGFAFERTNSWVFGADFSMGKWADYRIGNNNPGLNNTFGVAVGGQFTPDLTAVSSYFKLVDYRFGLKYDKTYITVNNTDINQRAVTFGFGFPLPSNRTTFYKINLTGELGQRGTLENSLIRERYLNIHLGFTLNDQWFIRPKFD